MNPFSKFTRAGLLAVLGVLCANSAGVCDDAVIPIPQIQGSGAQSAYDGKKVTTEGIVTGDFQDKDQLKGFYIQDEKGDGNPKTSDGLFVYIVLGNKLSKIDVKVGDRVRVSGTVDENGQQTQLENPTELTVLGQVTPPAPVSLTMPLPAGQTFEQYEDMLVTIPQALTITDNYHLSDLGALMLSAGGRILHPGMFKPGAANAAEPGGLPLPTRWIMLDDGKTAHNPTPVPYLNDQGTRRLGDTVAGLTGMLSYGLGEYRIHPTQPPVFTDSNPRPAAPDAVGGTIKVASYNVMNYFTTLSSVMKEARGAETDAEFARQSTKTVGSIKAMDADIIGFMEIQNNGQTTIDDLVAKINAAYGKPTYEVVPTPPQGLGSDLIRVALIFKPAKVKPIGASITDESPAYERYPLAQKFALVKNPATTILVVANHLKSRGSPPDEGDTDTGEGNWTRKRTLQAQNEALWVKGLQTSQSVNNVLIIGDFNCYAEESPLQAMKAQGFVALEDGIPPERRYSFVFQGRSGSIDHAFATPALKPLVTGISIWHINCDEPEFLSYKHAGSTDAPFRCSDHDPVVLGLNLN